MKQMFAIFILLGVVLFAVSMGSAHLRLDQTFVVPEVPDYLTVDGDGAEWQFLPRQYYVTMDDLEETVKGGIEKDPADLAVKVAFGWSSVTNKIYFWEERFDDISNARLTTEDRQESVELGIDADHGGDRMNNVAGIDLDSDRWEGALAQSYRYYLNREIPIWHWGASTWAHLPPYAEGAWSLDGVVAGEGVQTVEMAFTPWDDLHPDGVESSIVHTLAANEIIGIVFAVKDNDDPDNGGYDGGWWSISHATADCCMDLAVDYILLPFDEKIWSAVEADTWGRIKSTFRE